MQPCRFVRAFTFKRVLACLVDGGKEGFIKAILDVTSDVRDLPKDGAAFNSYLMARLVRKAHIPESSVAFISVHVEMDKKVDHVKMWEEFRVQSLI